MDNKVLYNKNEETIVETTNITYPQVIQTNQEDKVNIQLEYTTPPAYGDFNTNENNTTVTSELEQKFTDSNIESQNITYESIPKEQYQDTKTENIDTSNTEEEKQTERKLIIFDVIKPIQKEKVINNEFIDEEKKSN